MDMVDFVVPNLNVELVPWDNNNIGIQSTNEIHVVETNDEPNSNTINNDHNYIQEIQDITSPSTSLDVTTKPTNRNFLFTKKINEERELRIKKLKDSIEQQNYMLFAWQLPKMEPNIKNYDASFCKRVN
ncbi:hypothetical protein FQA39_LY16997 [Lamprigera yunnana]|nr:hypothetical protein FQA39_LY16997 [Lamprigera yunnana]